MAEMVVKGTPLYVKLVMLVSMILVIAGFIVPPTAVIDGSVLKAIGELMGAAMMFHALEMIPEYIKAGAKLKVKHGNSTIEVGARKHDGLGGGPLYAPGAETTEESEEEGGDDGTD